MSKKILSMALAVIMLISVFAFSASAAADTTTFPVGAQGGYRVVSDAYVGMPANSTVTVKVYFVFPADTDFETFRLHFNGNTALAYTDAFEYVSGSRQWGTAYSCMESTAMINESFYNACKGSFTAADKAMNWTKAIMIQKKGSVGAAYNETTGHPVNPYYELYTVKFTTTKVLTAADSIGIPAGIAGRQVAIRPQNGSNYTAANTILTEAVAYADVAKVSDTSTTKFRMSTEAGKVDLGITGTVKTISLDAGKTFENGRYVAKNLTAVGVQARVNGGAIQSAEDGYVYETADGYKFRAAITGMDAAGLSSNIEVRTFIKDTSGNTYYSNWMNIDAKTAHNASVSASGGAFAGIL